MFGASRSVMFERSSLLSNIEALYINSPVPPVIAEENAEQPRLFLCTFFTKIKLRKKRRDVIAEGNAQKPHPFLRTFLLQKYTQEGACLMHICKFYCLILVRSITF